MEQEIEPVSTGCVQGECPLSVIVRACYASTQKASTRNETLKSNICPSAYKASRLLQNYDIFLNVRRFPASHRRPPAI
ncbi:hypothetical protein C0557_27330 [Kosakonia sp. MUSA4]|nr:hypothetical protein C0557_27330 [Kosakonia sp. MUSA4]